MLQENDEAVALLDEAEGLVRRDPHESLRLANAFLETNTNLSMCLRARRIATRSNLYTGAYEVGEALGQESIKIAREAGERYEEAMAHNEVGVFRFVAEDYEGALGHYAAAEDLLRTSESENDLAKVYLNIGNVYYRKADVGNTLKYYELALQIAERTGDETMIAKVLINLTGLYGEYLRDSKTAMEYALRGVTYFERLNDFIGLSKAYMHLGVHAREQEHYEAAIAHFKKSIELVEKFHEPDELLSSFTALAECYIGLKDGDLCEATLRAAEAHPAFENKTELGQHYMNGGWAALYLYRREFVEAIAILERMHEHIKATGSHYLATETVRHLALAHTELGNHEIAVGYFTLLLDLLAESDRIEIERRLHNMYRQFEVKQYETEAEIERTRNAELAKAVDRLEQLHDENAEYLAFMAHELKSPLNTIRAITQLFMEDTELAPDDRRDLIVQVRSISTRMFDLINRVLDRAKGRHDDETAVVDVTLIWTYLLEQLRLRAQEKNIVLKSSLPSEPVHARILEMRLISILENLVSNSLKFSEQGTTVTVSVRRLYNQGMQTGPRLLLSVKDEGPGLSPEDMDRMFRPYQRLSASPTKGEDSTGLGLHIVRRDVERSGGRVWCESVAGQGSTFYVELPLVVPT